MGICSFEAEPVEIKTISKPLCLICGTQGETLHKSLNDHIFGVPGNWRMATCGNRECGIAWLDPAPEIADLPLLYTSYYTHSGQAAGVTGRAKLRSLFYKAYLLASSIPSYLLGLKPARRKLEHMSLEHTAPGRLLDVGCGSGIFLHRMAQLGWSGTGIDFDGKAIEYAKASYANKGFNLEFRQADLFEASFDSDQFDAVTMNHVIEHVPDPLALLSEIRRVLKPGGKLIAATPNIKSYGHQRFQTSWRGLEPPRHLQVFSRAALQECAKQAGFCKCKATTSAANADTIIGASFSIEAAANGGSAYRPAVQLNFLRGIRSLLLQYREAMLLRHDPEVGEELVLICEK